MVNTKISAFPAATALTGTEQFPVVQGGATKVANLNQFVTALQAGLLPDVPEWQPNFAYTANVLVLNPSGQIVSANTTFTSGGAYNPANWTVVSLTVTGVQALIAAQAATDAATYVHYDGTNLTQNGQVVPISGGGGSSTLTDLGNGLGSLTSSTLTDLGNGLAAVA